MQPNPSSNPNKDGKSLFGKTTTNQLFKTDANKIIFSGGSLFSPHANQPTTSQPTNNPPLFSSSNPQSKSIFGNIKFPTQNGPLFGGKTQLFKAVGADEKKNIGEQKSPLGLLFGAPKLNQQPVQKPKDRPQITTQTANPPPSLGLFQNTSKTAQGISGGIFGNFSGKTLFGNMGNGNASSSLFGEKKNQPSVPAQEKKQGQKVAPSLPQMSLFGGPKKDQTLAQERKSLFGDKSSLPPLFGGLATPSEPKPQEQKQQNKSSPFTGNNTNPQPIFLSVSSNKNQSKPQQSQAVKPAQPSVFTGGFSFASGGQQGSLFSNTESKKQSNPPVQAKKIELFSNKPESKTNEEKKPKQNTDAQNQKISQTLPNLFGGAPFTNIMSKKDTAPIVESTPASPETGQIGAIENKPQKNRANGRNQIESPFGKKINAPQIKQMPRINMFNNEKNGQIKGDELKDSVQLGPPEILTKNVDQPDKFQPSLFTNNVSPFNLPPKSPQLPKPASEDKNTLFDKIQKKDTQKRQRSRLPTFQIGKQFDKQPQSFIVNKQNKQRADRQNYFSIHKLFQLLQNQSEAYITDNAQKIENSFRKYLTISPDVNRQTQYVPVKFREQIQPDEGINNFLNDFTQQIAKLFSIPKQSYKAFGDIFDRMLNEQKFSDQLFDGLKLKEKEVSSSRIYKIAQGNKAILDWQSGEGAKLICEFIRYFSSLVCRCLKKIQNSIRSFKKTKIYELFLETTLLINQRYPQTQSVDIIQTMKSSDNQLTHQLNKILTNLTESWFMNQTTMSFISVEQLIKLIPVVNQLPACESTKIFIRILLRELELDKPQQPKNKELLEKIEHTNSKLFMPFRVILHRLDKSKKPLDPYQKDLFQQIDGPEWVDWLSLYLGEDNLRLKQKQTHYLIKALKRMKIRNVDKIVNKQSQIRRLIHIMAQQGQVKNFYETLSAIIYDQNSIKKVEQEFFKQDGTLSYDLRFLADEIRRFPNCQYNEEDLPQLYGKSIYLLTTLAIMPERAFQYENALFDMMGFIDVDSKRCDRICHLVIDILAYFSARENDDEIIVKTFETLTSLLSTNSTKQCMSLAMNVNRPQFDFFNKNLSKYVIEKINIFLSELVLSKIFYDSTRVPDQSITLSRAFPFRYSIQKYLTLTENTQSSIPLYWFSSCLKLMTKQSYNPELLEMILSKLRIYASNELITETPFILPTIVDACNGSTFWKEFSDSLNASNYFYKNKFGIFNKLMAEQPQFSASVANVFFSLKLLKTMLQLRKIRNNAGKVLPKHFIFQFLSSLHCLNQVDRHYMQSAGEVQFFSIKNISPIVSLFSLICKQSQFLNLSRLTKIEWLYFQNLDVNIEELRKNLKKNAQNIDYTVLIDILVHPFNKELDCFENIASLAFQCLNEILSQCKDVSIERLLYMSVPKKNNKNNMEDFESLKSQIIESFIKALESPVPSLSRNAWKLLVTMRSNPQNKKITQQIFREYHRHAKIQIENASNLKYLFEFLLCQVKQGLFTYSELISDLLESISNTEIKNMLDLIEIYKRKSLHNESLHQFDRLMLERKMLITSEFYDIISLLSQIILEELFAHGSNYYPALTRHSSLLINIIAKSKLLDIYDAGYQTQQLDGVIISDYDNPRLFGLDILQNYITNPTLTREDMLPTQIDNVVNWFCNKIENLDKSVSKFLSIMLSIDQTYYANHESKLKAKKKSELFCQLHMGIIRYRAQQLLGKNDKQAVLNVKMLIDSSLTRVEKPRRGTITDDLIKTYALIDLLLEWLRSYKNTKKIELNLYCKKVMTICFPRLGGPIFEPIIAKLLLTCVKIMQGQLTQDLASSIKETIAKTVESVYIMNSEMKQEILSLLILIPPSKNDVGLMELVAKLWCTQQNNEYFYNESRVMLKLCELLPIEIAKMKILSRCERISRLQDASMQSVRYREGLRTNQTKSWIWILKIVSTLMENGSHSTIVTHEVSKFVQNSKKRLIFTFNQPRQQINLKNKSREIPIQISLAQLDELQASLQFFIVLAQSKMWVQMNRQIFEEMLYYLMHRTIVMFAPNSVGERLRKKYIPQSLNQKVIWKIQTGDKLPKTDIQSYLDGDEMNRIDEQMTDQMMYSNTFSLSVFIFGMSLRFNDCLKLWLLACSTGMRSSCFVREYFSKLITTDLKGSNLKYSLTHWDHLNKAIVEIIQSIINRIKEWGKWENTSELLNLLYDSFNSGEVFTQTGYLYSIIRFPETEQDLFSELGETLSLALEMGACHLVSQVYFRNKNGTFSKQNLQGFEEKLFRLSALAQQKLVQNKVEKKNEVFDHIKAGRRYLQEIQI